MAPTAAGDDYSVHPDEDGTERIVWVQEALPGRPCAEVHPHTTDLVRQVGRVLGRMDRSRAALVDTALERIAARGELLAGFIAETYPSVGDQIIPPPGYLAGVCDRIRATGGICIADKIQTGLGRLGSHYVALEEQGVVPDIVVLGKPIGNGHPIGVVVTTRDIADAFSQGPEFFSTFGGSTLSCRIGHEVLQIDDNEGLMENAGQQGAVLLDGLRALQADAPNLAMSVDAAFSSASISFRTRTPGNRPRALRAI